MPILAAWIGSLLSSLASFFAAFFTKRLAIVAAAIVAAGVITAAFTAAIDALASGIAFAAPAAISIGASWVLPYNADQCVAAIIAGHLLRWAYDWNVKILEWKIL